MQNDIDREALLDAIFTDLPVYEADNMFHLALGGLRFLITGEDGNPLSDADLHSYAAIGKERFSHLLYMDLKEAWQGIPPGEEKRARYICDHLAGMYCRFFTEQEDAV